MIGFIIGVGVLALAVNYFTGQRAVDWKQVGIWLAISYIPLILVMFLSFAFIVGGGMDHIPWWLMLVAGLMQLGILYFFMENYYGREIAFKILGTYAVIMLIVGWIL